jgi:hypothetical protein
VPGLVFERHASLLRDLTERPPVAPPTQASQPPVVEARAKPCVEEGRQARLETSVSKPLDPHTKRLEKSLPQQGNLDPGLSVVGG